MKKFIFLFVLCPMVLFGQDLSWGISTYNGLGPVDDYYGKRSSSSSLGLYMDKRIGGSSWHFKTELNFKSLNIPSDSIQSYYQDVNYYYTLNSSNFYTGYAIFHYPSKTKVNLLNTNFLFSYSFGSLDIYSGIALNLFQRGRIKFRDGASIEQFNTTQYQSGFSDEELISIYQDVHQNEINQNNSVQIGLASPVIGFNFHLNSFNIGFRRSYGVNQLTLGYDIGRYRYE
jgi:hypothetical protein